METVKIVFDVDSKDIKTTTDELKALNKITNEEVKALDNLSTAAEDAGDGFVSLRSQVRQAKEEAQKAAEKYGEFSKEANAARVKAGALADQMGDLNRQVNLLNPEAKAKAFSNLAQGVVGAFSIATGALQAFGVKNKEVEELAMKLQGALNITQGIASFGALKESLQDVKVVLGFTTAAQESLTVAKEVDVAVTNAGTAANKTFIASLATNPIFLVVAAIGALAAAYITLNDEVKSAILNEKELADAKKKTTELKNKELQTSIDLRVANKEISKQAGEREKIEAKRLEDTKELVKQTKNLTDEQVKSNKKIIDLNKEAEQLRKDALKERDPELRKALQANASAAESQLRTEKEKNAKIKESNQTLQEQLNVINKTAVNESKQQTIDELNENKSKNEKLTEQNKAKAAKDKAERDREAKERAQTWDRIMAEMDAEGKAEADKIEQNNKKRLALEKQLADELIRFRRLSVKGDNVKEIQLEMDLLDEKYAANLLNLQRTAMTDQQYAEGKAVLDQQYANDQIELNNKTTDIAIANADKEVKANEEKNAKLLEEDKKTAEKRKEILLGGVDALRFITQWTSEADAAAREEEMAQLEDQKNKKIISEEEYQKRLKAIRQKQAEDQKKAAIYQATLDFATALINALTFKPATAVPAALVLASVLAAANLAKIAATPIPKFQKGTLAVPGVDMGRDSVHAMLQPGEAVIPVSTNRAYHPTIKAIYEKKISPSEINNFVMSRTSSGGKQSITANVDTYALGRALGKNKGVQIENAQVVGRVIAKELNTYNVRRGW